MARILVTNDDGIDSPGLWELARTASRAGHRVVIAAPASDASGTSASITVPEDDGQLDVVPRVLPGLEHVAAYALAAPPALITLVAIRGGLGEPPELVLSGINRGSNTGHAVLHSGTVGAALTAAANGCPGLAVSAQVRRTPEEVEPYWRSAAQFVPALLPVLRETSTPVVLNLNAPAVPPDRVRGLREARLATFGAVQTNVAVGDGYVQLALADTGATLEPGTDSAWLAEGYATVSAITPIFEVAQVSLREVVEAVRVDRDVD